MIRRLFTLLTVLSLILCAATMWLWVRSFRHEDRVSRLVRGKRYTVVSASGSIVAYVPPPPVVSPRVRRAAEDLVGTLRNDQVCWVVVCFGESASLPPSYDVECAEALLDTPASDAWLNFKPDEVVAPLLIALEDPSRFAAAHVLLWLHLRRGRGSEILPSRTVPGRYLGKNPDDWDGKHPHANAPWLEVDHDGLTVTLNRWLGPGRPSPWGKDMDEHGLLGDADAAQLPRIREQWHRRLDVAVSSMAWKHVFLVTAVLPGLHLVLAVRRRLRHAAALRRNRCLNCGYDLRATADRCPECGTRINPHESK